MAPEKPRWLFPDWPSAGFDWGGYPVIGFRYADDRETRTRTSTVEAGLGIQASGVPIKEGNPGASIAPSAGYALGFVTLVPEAGKTQTGVYHRVWGGLEVPILVKFTRSTLGVRYGQINGKLVEKSKMGGFTFDEGVLVLPYFATHYTYEYLRLFRTAWGSPAIVSHDNWFSLHFFTSVLNSRVAFGPGVTFSDFYVRQDPASESTSLYADTRTDYLRLAAASDLFWKLRANLDSRYVIDVNRKEGGLIEEVSQTRLPNQSLSDGPALPLYPKDTLLTSAFFGIKGLIGGLGFGYRYTLEVFDLNARGGRKTRRRESSGVGLIYEAKF